MLSQGAIVALYANSIWLNFHTEVFTFSHTLYRNLGSKNFSTTRPKPQLVLVTPPEYLALIKRKPISGKCFQKLHNISTDKCCTFISGHLLWLLYPPESQIHMTLFGLQISQTLLHFLSLGIFLCFVWDYGLSIPPFLHLFFFPLRKLI